MQIVDGTQKPRHTARHKNEPMKLPVRLFPSLNIAGMIARTCSFFRLIKDRLGQMRNSVA